MPRPLRLEYPGAFWHIHNRGVDRRDIFLDDTDRLRFLALTAGVQSYFRWRVHAYTLMTNHYHLFVETLEPTLSRGMQKLDGDYAASFNHKEHRTGPLFEGRFKAHLVEKDSYLVELARYIVLNPVRAQMVETPGDWEWSSYRATAGLSSAPKWLEIGLILDAFEPRDRVTASRLYREFVAAGVGKTGPIWDELRAKLYLGGEKFIARIEELTASRKPTATEPAQQRNLRAIDGITIQRLVETSLGVSLVPKKWSNEMARLVYASLMRTESIATFSEIARVLGLTPSGARGLTHRAAVLESEKESFRATIDALRIQISHFKKRV